ncbi:calcium-binding protein [Williamsia sp. 1135]|uniref:calcium-binding protein n=1 Tax=Williamsia sp. 1135 TaxID=1889262 RepID=UPI000A10BBD1|nr:calcium-binding protein [Williamsia sp. 1135]ORM30255.1 calcium-binding protein [Williamsia sp. 1135]
MTLTISSPTGTRIANATKTAAVLAGAVAALAACGGGDAAADTATTGSQSTAVGPAEAVAAVSPYADGEYTAVGTYTSPGGEQELGVTVTLSNSVITALTLDTSDAQGPSAGFQNNFDLGVTDKGLVVGKSIDDLEISKVSGSSLTSIGFNDAIDQIKAEAQA